MYQKQEERGQWDYEKKGWKCDLSKYLNIKKRLEESNIKVQGIPDFVYQVVIPIRDKLTFSDQKSKYEIEYSEEDLNKSLEKELDKDVISRLFQFQKQGVQFGLQNNGRILLADEMGVGKTIQAICLASCFKQAWPLVVICPSSLKYVWRDEVLKWVKTLKDQNVQIFAKKADEISITTQVLICSYDILPKILDKIQKFRFNIAVADEAHYLKNSQAKRTIAIVPILQKIKHVILLTGTPAFARPKELFTLLSIIRPDIFMAFKQFGNRYCNPKPAKFGGGIDYTGSSNEKELYYILKKQIMIRRLKDEVLSQLPSKRRKKVHVNVDPKILQQIQQILKQTNSSLDSLFETTNQAITDEDAESSFPKHNKYFSALTHCYLLSGQAKLAELKCYIQDLLENDVKIIVFANHLEMLNALENFVVNELRINSIRIDGSVKSEARYERVLAFQNDDSVRVAILSLSAASTGLTLTASSNIVFAEMHWTPAIMQQAEDRAHRIGQKNSVLCHYILGEKTLDDLLYKKIDEKVAIVSNILDGEKKQLKIDEFQNLQGPKISLSQNEQNQQDNNDDIEIQIGSIYSGQKQTYSQQEFIKSLKEQKENQKLIDQVNQIQINQDQQQIENCLNESDSDSEDDDTLQALKMIAQQELKKKKDNQDKRNDKQSQNSSTFNNGNVGLNAKLKKINSYDSEEYLFDSQKSSTNTSDENNKNLHQSISIKHNFISQKNQNDSMDTQKQSQACLNLFQTGFEFLDEAVNTIDSSEDESQNKMIINIETNKEQYDQNLIQSQQIKDDLIKNQQSYKNDNHNAQKQNQTYLNSFQTGFEFLDDAINTIDSSDDESQNQMITNIQQNKDLQQDQNKYLLSLKQNEQSDEDKFKTDQLIIPILNNKLQNTKLQNIYTQTKESPIKQTIGKQEERATKIIPDNEVIYILSDDENEEINNDYDNRLNHKNELIPNNKDQQQFNKKDNDLFENLNNFRFKSNNKKSHSMGGPYISKSSKKTKEQNETSDSKEKNKINEQNRYVRTRKDFESDQQQNIQQKENGNDQDRNDTENIQFTKKRFSKFNLN